jgi:hypothetical protein
MAEEEVTPTPNPLKRADAETLKKYRELEARLLDDLARIRAVLRALGYVSPVKDLNAMTPIIDDVRTYLRERGEPVCSSEIIRDVGERRKKRYPGLLRPFGDIWKSLQFHDKHEREIVCVEFRGKVVKRSKLKKRPKQRAQPGGKTDSADFYKEPNNLFWFLDEIKR